VTLALKSSYLDHARNKRFNIEGPEEIAQTAVRDVTVRKLLFEHFFSNQQMFAQILAKEQGRNSQNFLRQICKSFLTL